MPTGQIQLDPVLFALPASSDLELCSRSPGTVLMWSFGNYNTINGRAAFSMANGGRRGVNDAHEYQKLLDVCTKNSILFFPMTYSVF